METIEVPETSCVIVIHETGEVGTKLYYPTVEADGVINPNPIAPENTTLVAVVLGYLADMQQDPAFFDEQVEKYLSAESSAEEEA